MRRPTLVLLAAAALVAAPLSSTTSAAPAAPEKITVDSGLITPLSVAVRQNGTIFVSQNFVGTITKIAPGHAPKDILHVKGEAGALSVAGGVLTYAITRNNGNTVVKQRTSDGAVSTLASLSAHEESENPDSVIDYGAVDITEECAAEWPVEMAGPPTYPGIVESHPYASWGDGETTWVADAAANAIFEIDSSGTVTTLAVLDAVPIEITEELAAEFGIPECAVGLTYYGESVPTDIEMGTDGSFHVTTLAGGLGEAAAAGQIVSVDPTTGDTAIEVEGFEAPVGLAIAPSGDTYVTELFADNGEMAPPGNVAVVPDGTSDIEDYRSAVLPAAIEYSVGRLYVTVDSLAEEPPFGRLVSWVL